jgi:hypothetical protein
LKFFLFALIRSKLLEFKIDTDKNKELFDKNYELLQKQAKENSINIGELSSDYFFCNRVSFKLDLKFYE